MTCGRRNSPSSTLSMAAGGKPPRSAGQTSRSSLTSPWYQPLLLRMSVFPVPRRRGTTPSCPPELAPHPRGELRVGAHVDQALHLGGQMVAEDPRVVLADPEPVGGDDNERLVIARFRAQWLCPPAKQRRVRPVLHVDGPHCPVWQRDPEVVGVELRPHFG